MAHGINVLPNIYPGRCTCGAWVPAGAGKAERVQYGRHSAIAVRCTACLTPREEAGKARGEAA